MHHRKARKTRLVRFVKLPYMVEAGVLRYPYPFVHCHTPFWWSNSCCEISNRTVLRTWKLCSWAKPLPTVAIWENFLRREWPQKNTLAVLEGGMCGWHVSLVPRDKLRNTQQRQMPCFAQTVHLSLFIFQGSDVIRQIDHTIYFSR